MSKIFVKFDTETRAFSATLDGKPADVQEIFISQRDPAETIFNCSLTAATEADGEVVVTRLAAAASAEAQSSKGAPASKSHPGFVVIDSRSKACEDVGKYFLGKRR